MYPPKPLLLAALLLALLLRAKPHGTRAAGTRRTNDRAVQLLSDLKARLPQEQLVVLQERVQAQSSEAAVVELLAQSKTEEMQPCTCSSQPA